MPAPPIPTISPDLFVESPAPAPPIGPGPELDPAAVVARLLPVLQGKLDLAIGSVIDTAILLFTLKQKKATAVLEGEGRPSDAHSPDTKDRNIIINRIKSGVGSLVRIAMIPAQRERMLQEVQTPKLNKERIKDFIRQTLDREGRVLITQAMDKFLVERGKYGRAVSVAIRRAVPLSKISSLIFESIDEAL
jgi:hypothetical protein